MVGILIVEDEDLVAELLSETLRENGHEVRVAHDGAEGLRLLEERPPDLLLLNLMLPELGGWELLARKEQNARLRAVPVVMMTGASVSRAQREGLAGFLAKPFLIEELLAMVHTLFPSP